MDQDIRQSTLVLTYTLGWERVSDYIRTGPQTLFNSLNRKGRLSKNRVKKLKVLSRLCDSLVRSYDREEIQNWLFKKYDYLDNRSPDEILKSDWKPRERKVQRILKLAQNMSQFKISCRLD